MNGSDATVTVPAEHRRAVAGAIYQAAANVAVRASKIPAKNARRRAELVREAQGLREIAEDVA